MFDRFKNHITSSRFFNEKDKLIVAVSGGLDSMVLAHLLESMGFHFEVAHVNHNTREGESDKDERFVLEFFRDKGIHVHIKRLIIPETGNFHGLAHRGRYRFFNSLSCDKILTAHHIDDEVETIFINFINGRSIDGINAVYGKVVRPLMPFSKQDLLAYAKEHQLSFVEDSSNAQSDYLRNLVRNEIIPKLESRLNLQARLLGLSHRISSEQQLLRSLINEQLEINYNHENAAIFKNLFLNKEPLYIQLALSEFSVNLSQARNLLTCLEKVGTIISTKSHSILIDREKLIITKLEAESLEEIHFELSDLPLDIRFGKFILNLTKTDAYKLGNETVQYLPLDLVTKPLTIRVRRPGDSFAPLGLEGKKQKLKQFFIDRKMDRFTKRDYPLLCHGEDIAIVLGLRTSENYKITKEHNSFLQITTLI